MKSVFKIMLVVITIAGSAVYFTSCDDYFFNSVHGNGVVKTEVRSSYYFNSVNVQGSFDVDIVQDTVNEVIIEAEETIIPYILTGVKDETLIIKSLDNTWLRNTRPIRIHVRLVDASKFILSGSGSIISDTLKSTDIGLVISGSGFIDIKTVATNVDANISGSGDITLRGSCYSTYLNISGSGKIQAQNLVHKTCKAVISGSGDMYVDVSDVLDVVISGSGSIFYHGNPVIYQRISGSGEVIRI